MWHLSKFTPFVISSSSHCFWSSGDMSITRSRGYTSVNKLRVCENMVIRTIFEPQTEEWEYYIACWSCSHFVLFTSFC
jgi:hypothetical protein